MKKYHPENGGVLIYILIAIAALAALSFAVTQGGRDSTTSLSADKTKLMATEIIDYGNAIKNAVTTLRLRGVKFDDIRFSHAGTTDYGVYGAAPTHEIFNPAGGGIVYKLPDETAFTYSPVLLFTAGNIVQDVGTNCQDGTCSELIMMVNPLKEEVCLKLDELVGVSAAPNAMPESADVGLSVFMGTGPMDNMIGAISASDPLRGKSAGCFWDGANGAYFYYQVLFAR